MAEVRITIPDALVPTWGKVRSLVVLGWLAALQAQIGGCSLPPLPWPTPTPAPVPPTPTPTPVVAGPLEAVLVVDPTTETPDVAGLRSSVKVRADLPSLDCRWNAFRLDEDDATRPGFAELVRANPAPFVAIYSPGGKIHAVLPNPTEDEVVATVRRLRGK